MFERSEQYLRRRVTRLHEHGLGAEGFGRLGNPVHERLSRFDLLDVLPLHPSDGGLEVVTGVESSSDTVSLPCRWRHYRNASRRKPTIFVRITADAVQSVPASKHVEATAQNVENEETQRLSRRLDPEVGYRLRGRCS